jgi:hypothetical protein
MSDSVPLFVPTRSTSSASDVLALLSGRRPGGERVGIAFTGLDLLRAACGPRQDWIRLHESALRGMLAPHGVTIIQFDPVLVGPDVGHPAEQVDTPAPAPAAARALAGHRGR